MKVWLPPDTSTATPAKVYARYLKACDRTAALRAQGTKISQARGKVEEKHIILRDYNRACHAYVWRPERATILQRILDAAMDKERANDEAVQSHTIYKTRRNNIIAEKEERDLRGLIDDIDRHYPPAEKPPVAYEPAERASALVDIEAFDTTPHVWRELEPCGSGSCGMCKYCLM